MDTPQCPGPLDQAAFGRVWRRVMPQDRPDCPFLLDPPPAEQPPPSVRTSTPHPLPAGGCGTSAPHPVAASPAPSAGPLCLGPSSAGDLGRLDPLATRITQGLILYRSLARRNSAALPLARKKADHLGRLSAARYLISGRRSPEPGPVGARAGGGLLPLLREQYHAEEALVLSLFTAAQAAADPCLRELYRQLALETRELAGTLRRWLERALS